MFAEHHVVTLEQSSGLYFSDSLWETKWVLPVWETLQEKLKCVYA